MRMPSIFHAGLVFTSASLLLAACGDPKSNDNPTTTNVDPTNTSESDTDAATTGVDSETDPTNASAESDPTDASATMGDSSSDDGGVSDSAVFIIDPDGAGVNNECDIWAQDCMKGEKCMPWDNAGGNSWNATRCSPVDDNPGQPGDSCTVEGSGVSGIDDCALSSMSSLAPPSTRWMPSCVSRMASSNTSTGSEGTWKMSTRHCSICITVLLRRM